MFPSCQWTYTKCKMQIWGQNGSFFPRLQKTHKSLAVYQVYITEILSLLKLLSFMFSNLPEFCSKRKKNWIFMWDLLDLTHQEKEGKQRVMVVSALLEAFMHEGGSRIYSTHCNLWNLHVFKQTYVISILFYITWEYIITQ